MSKMTESKCKYQTQTVTVNVKVNMTKYEHRCQLQNEAM